MRGLKKPGKVSLLFSVQSGPRFRQHSCHSAPGQLVIREASLKKIGMIEIRHLRAPTYLERVPKSVGTTDPDSGQKIVRQERTEPRPARPC